MTAYALRPCAHAGCRKYAAPGRNFCAEHEGLVRREYQARVNARRGSSTKQGYDSRWRAAREAWLAEHPLCVECEKRGRLTPATDVDHIRPHKGDKKLFWDRSNWQSLCHSCHSRKTAREDGGYGRRKPPGRV